MSEPARRRAEAMAAAVLLRAGPAAAFVVLGVCVLATVLVPAGWWRPAVVGPLVVVVAVAAGWAVRGVPAQLRERPVPPWVAAASVAVAVGFGVWAGLTRSEHMILRRDAGSYALFAHWLATRHGLPVDAELHAFGGVAALGVPGFTVASPAFFQVLTGSGGAGPDGATGVDVVPQFLLGAPALYSLGWWPAGWAGIFVMPALVGGLAILAAAGLAARLVGPAWAPVVATALALTQPVLHAARTTLSEPLALLLVLAAAALAVDAVDRPPSSAGTRRLAVAAGSVLGLAGLVRIDVLREVAVAVPFCAVLALRRHRAGIPLAATALAGAGLSMVPAWWLSRPYLDQVGPSLRPLALAAAGLAVICATVVIAARRRQRRLPVDRPPALPDEADAAACPRGGGRWLEWAAAGAVLAAAGLLASRPWWMTVRQSAADSAVPLIASLQEQQGLSVDGSRTYAERSVEWLVWYVGPVAALAAMATAGVLAAMAVRWWRSGREAVPGWLVPLGVALGSVLLTLWRPGITPDHPWADRRLVPVVLPAVVLAAGAAAAWSVRQVHRTVHGRGWPPVRAIVAVLVTAGLLVPPAFATWPLATTRTEVGQPAAADQVCGALRPGDAVVAIADAKDRVRAPNEWVQVVRGVCGHPSAALTVPVRDPATLRRLAGLVAGAGGRLVLLAAGEEDQAAPTALAGLGLDPRQVVRLRTTEDQHLLQRRPFAVDALVVDVWLAVWEPSEAG